MKRVAINSSVNQQSWRLVSMFGIKNKLKVFSVFVSSMAVTLTGFAATATFTATIVVLTALSITAGANLDFGTIESSSSAQSITVSPEGTGAATFQIDGEPNDTVTVSVVESSISMSDGTNSMTVNAFTVGGTSCTGGAGTLDGAGNLDSCEVGATISVGAGQVAGTYTGSATLSVVYN
jgi:hypothetical protein